MDNAFLLALLPRLQDFPTSGIVHHDRATFRFRETRASLIVFGQSVNY
jgi:hypothetical protein